eukprot:567370-Heterocapsa_arctica.AAC.1
MQRPGPPTATTTSVMTTRDTLIIGTKLTRGPTPTTAPSGISTTAAGSLRRTSDRLSHQGNSTGGA